jgi:hypothetical protein
MPGVRFEIRDSARESLAFAPRFATPVAEIHDSGCITVPRCGGTSGTRAMSRS